MSRFLNPADGYMRGLFLGILAPIAQFVPWLLYCWSGPRGIKGNMPYQIEVWLAAAFLVGTLMWLVRPSHAEPHPRATLRNRYAFTAALVCHWPILVVIIANPGELNRTPVLLLPFLPLSATLAAAWLVTRWLDPMTPPAPKTRSDATPCPGCGYPNATWSGRCSECGHRFLLLGGADRWAPPAD